MSKYYGSPPLHEQYEMVARLGKMLSAHKSLYTVNHSNYEKEAKRLKAVEHARVLKPERFYRE